MLDRVFLTEVITAMMDTMDPVLFGTFDFVAPKKRHIQPNGYDCGVFVIRNMQHYGGDWSANVRNGFDLNVKNNNYFKASIVDT